MNPTTDDKIIFDNIFDEFVDFAGHQWGIHVRQTESVKAPFTLALLCAEIADSPVQLCDLTALVGYTTIDGTNLGKALAEKAWYIHVGLTNEYHGPIFD